ncbi:hypothetical protein PQX77_007957 [Marasmius sp. AFHP31]|nr:hypothetical protein PQX77_007957 [Marasmius sp. AFHP31]
MNNTADADKVFCSLFTTSIITTAPTPNPPLLSLDAQENISKTIQNANPHCSRPDANALEQETSMLVPLGNQRQRSTGGGKPFQIPDTVYRYPSSELHTLHLKLVHPQAIKIGLNAVAIDNTIPQIEFGDQSRWREEKSEVCWVETLDANYYELWKKTWRISSTLKGWRCGCRTEQNIHPSRHLVSSFGERGYGKWKESNSVGSGCNPRGRMSMWDGANSVEKDQALKTCKNTAVLWSSRET